MQHRVETPEAMLELGRSAAERVQPGTVISLIGGLGAGKTHWTKGFVAGVGSVAEVTSPTFGLVHEYVDGKIPVYHFDFYRLENAAELIALGWDEYLDAGGIVIAEWGDRFPELLPTDCIRFVFTIQTDGARTVQREQE